MLVGSAERLSRISLLEGLDGERAGEIRAHDGLCVVVRVLEAQEAYAMQES